MWSSSSVLAAENDAHAGPDAPGTLPLDAAGQDGRRRARDRRPRGGVSTQRWARLLHVYTSMACFVVVLFFAVTGITLNHPDWSLGGASRTTAAGTLPSDWRQGGDVDWLLVAEHLRATHGLRGSVSSYSDSAVQASIEFAGPGYAASAFIDPENGDYDLTVEAQGVLAVMNDLHKGRDTGSAWRWLIDVAGGFLLVISLTGLVLQLVLRKRRRTALLSAAGGTLVVVLMVVLATN